MSLNSCFLTITFSRDLSTTYIQRLSVLSPGRRAPNSLLDGIQPNTRSKLRYSEYAFIVDDVQQYGVVGELRIGGCSGVYLEGLQTFWQRVFKDRDREIELGLACG